MLSTASRAALLLGTAAVAVVTATGVAYAAPDTMDAPYAQAAARINANGSILASKGIDTVTRPQAGTYCVTFTKNLDLPHSAPQATVVGDYGTVTLRMDANSLCNNQENTLTVLTRNTNSVRDNIAFTLAIP